VLGCGSESTIKPGTDPDAVVWTQLTSLPRSDFAAIYPDWRGDSVTFTGLDLVTKSQLRIGYVDVKDGASAYIPTYPGPAAWLDARARWVRSGLVIFESGRDLINHQSDLYYREVDTGQDHRLMFTTGSDEHYPAPQPGGPGLVYAEGQDLKGRLVYMPDTAVTANRSYLTRPGFLVSEPGWDPTGTKIVFSADSATGTTATSRHLYWIAIGDTTTHKLTTGPYNDQSPQFSPDGTKILFASDRSGRSSVWIVDPAGQAAGLKRIAFEDVGASIYTPCWSPDGTRVMVASNGSGQGRQLWILSNLQLQFP
jgi:Tol biopolymer transport system component